MTIAIANVNTSTDSFGQWIEKTNKALYAISYKTITVDSNTSVGNSAITGTFTSNSLITNSTISVGYTTANVIISNTNMAIRSSLTTNTVYTANGMTIDGATFYTSSIMKLGNTTLRFNNVSSNAGYFNSNVTVGNTVLYRNRILTDAMNVKVLYVSTNETIGDPEANVYMDRYGLQIYDNPTGLLVQNSKMTSTDLWIKNIHSNGTIEANNVIIRGKLDLNGTSGNIVFTSNVAFLGQNNHFAYGLTSNGNVGIGKGFLSPQTMLHLWKGQASPALPINSNTILAIEANDQNNLIEFRNSNDQGQIAGLIFVDNNQGGYMVYNTPGGSSGDYGDKLRLGGYSGINFEIGGETGQDGIASKQVVMQVISTGATVNGIMRFIGSTSGYTELVANADAGSVRFTLPTVDGSNEQAMVTDGSGKLGWKTIPSIGALTDLQLNSLGVGTPASGVTGEIRATSDITAFYSSDKSLKTNIKNISNSLEKISKINGVEFDWIDDVLFERGGEDDYFNRKHDVGVIAQEIEQVLPEVVGTRENGIKAVKYDRIVALLIEGIKELKAELDEVKKNGGCNCGCK
jgi:hypothetical protein